MSPARGARRRRGASRRCRGPRVTADRLAAGPVQAARPWRQARDRGRGSRAAPPRAPRARTRSPSAPAAAPRKMPPILSGPGLPERERGEPAGDGEPRRPGPARRRAGVDRAAQDRRRDRARIEQRPEREEQGRRGTRPGPATIAADAVASSSKGTNGWSSGASSGWATVPEGAPARLPRAPRASACAQVDAVSVRALGAQHLQDRDRRDLPREERAHGGRHADAADEQARQPDQPEVRRELVEEAPQPGLSLVVGRRRARRDRPSPRQPRARRARLELGGSRTSVRWRTRLPSRTRPVASRLGGVQEHARPQGEERRGAVGLLLDDAGHGEASRRRSRARRRRRGRAGRGAPPRPRRRRSASSSSSGAPGRSRAGRRADSRRRPPSARRGGAAARGPARHRHQLAHAATAAPRRTRSLDRRLRGGVERAGRAQLDVAARGARAPRARASGRGRRPRSGRRRAPRRRARCTRGSRRSGARRRASPPGQGQDEAPRARRAPSGGGRLARRVPTTRPSRSSTIRSAKAARAGSWVTRTSVTPWLAVEPDQELDDLRAGRESRLPVGSSASSRRAGATRAQGDPLLLAARELRRVVVPRAALRPTSSSRAPARARRPPRRPARAGPRRSRGR